MRILFLVLFYFLVVSTEVHCQGEWTWKWGPIGSASMSSAGQGVFAPTNFPESRYAAVCWTDPNGKFWRYGGGGMGDLWQFDPSINQWAFMHGSLVTPAPPIYGTQGISAALNRPGEDAFGHPAWADSQGNLWLYSIGFTDDLWKYSIATNQWTWMKGTGGGFAAAVYGTLGVPGATVSPGPCNETDCKWTDANDNLWLFNELDGVLWKYDPLINQWARMHGVANGAPIYGTLGVAAPANRPGQFSACPSVGALFCMWQDASNDLWMMINRDGATVNSEIWKYSIVSNQWACMRINSSAFGASQSYGTQCVESAAIFPIPRTELRARWVDDCDNLWMYGGAGFCNMSTDYGDLWRYSPLTNNWTWIRGTTAGPVFGVQGVSAPTNQPTPGVGQQHWENESGFWLQGGQNIGGASLHHMWLYSPDSVLADFLFSSNCLTTDFTDQSSSGCNAIKSHAWNFGDPVSGVQNTSSDPNPTHTFSGNGTYQVTLVVTNCTWDVDTIVQSVTVNCGVTINLNSDSICVGDCIDLIANTTGGAAPYTYQWNNGITSSTAGPITVCPTTTTTYSVVVTDNLGETDTTTATIFVFDPPVIDLGNDTVLCLGESLLLDAGNTGLNYQWQDGSSSQTYFVASSGVYWVEVSGEGCLRVDTISVNFVGPTVNLGNDTLLCSDENILLNAGNSGSSYVWQDGSVNQTFLVSSAGEFWVNVTDGSCSVSDTIAVFIQEVEASLVAADMAGCLPLTISFMDQSAVNPGSIVSWLWDFGDGSTSTLSSPSHTYTNTGNYAVKLSVSSNSGCADDTLLSTSIVGYPSAMAGFSHAPNDLLPGDLVQFSNLSSNASSWLWSFGDGNESTDQHPTHSYGQEGAFLVTLIAMNEYGCNDTVSYQIVIESDLLLFVPNAFTADGNEYNNEWIFSILGADSEGFEVRIYDRWGELIWESHEITSGWDGSYSGERVQDGVYTWLISCKAKSTGKQYTFRGHVTVLR